MFETLKYPKLRGRIVEKFGTLNNFAKATGKSKVTISKKLNRKVAFSTKDIRTWANLLDISDNELRIFFEI